MEGKQINRKKLKISKNRKKGWKKTDVTEVEDFLEDERLQERTGYIYFLTYSSAASFLNREC